mgnify:CR=1 FL=1
MEGTCIHSYSITSICTLSMKGGQDYYECEDALETTLTYNNKLPAEIIKYIIY